MGYIGSHTAVTLTKAGHEVCIYDSLSNSKITVLARLETITGKCFPFIQGDVRDTAHTARLGQTLRLDKIDAEFTSRT